MQCYSIPHWWILWLFVLFFLPINNVVTNILVYISLCICSNIAVEYIPRVGLLDQNMWTFLRLWAHTAQLPFRKLVLGVHVPIAPVPLAPYPCRHWVFSLILANLIDGRCYLNFFNNQEGWACSLCFLVISSFSLSNLFMSFACFFCLFVSLTKPVLYSFLWLSTIPLYASAVIF